jgi:hypothetical protein
MSDPEPKEKPLTITKETIFRTVYDLNLVYGRGQLQRVSCGPDGRGEAVAKLQYGESKFGFRYERKPDNKITVFARGHQRTVKLPNLTTREISDKYGFKPLSYTDFRNSPDWYCSIGK